MSNFSVEEHIEPVENLSLVEEVELRLMKLLASRELSPGDMLPKEEKLANAFGVSRTVIREALTRLKTRGVVESIKHKGTKVTHPDILSNLKSVLHPQILDSQTLRDIFEMRLVLEVGMADLLFDRINEDHLRQLDDIVEGEPGGGDNVVYDIDFEVQFHGTLYEITDNHTLCEFQKLLLPIFDHVHNFGALEGIDTDGAYVSHKKLVEVLREGTPAAFRHAMRQHLDSQFRRIFSTETLSETPT